MMPTAFYYCSKFFLYRYKMVLMFFFWLLIGLFCNFFIVHAFLQKSFFEKYAFTRSGNMFFHFRSYIMYMFFHAFRRHSWVFAAAGTLEFWPRGRLSWVFLGGPPPQEWATSGVVALHEGSSIASRLIEVLPSARIR